MKKNALVKELKKYGWFLLREGANHEIWANGRGDQVPVGRHPDVPELTAKSTIKKAKMNPGVNQ